MNYHQLSCRPCVMLCYVMSCHVMLCYVMGNHPNPQNVARASGSLAAVCIYQAEARDVMHEARVPLPENTKMHLENKNEDKGKKRKTFIRCRLGESIINFPLKGLLATGLKESRVYVPAVCDLAM